MDIVIKEWEYLITISWSEGASQEALNLIYTAIKAIPGYRRLSLGSPYGPVKALEVVFGMPARPDDDLRLLLSSILSEAL